MKAFTAICLLAVAIVAHADHHHVVKAKWASYKADHSKEYHPEEEHHRLNNFLATSLEITEHNQRYHNGEVSYFLAHNHFSDMTVDEVKSKYLGKKTMSVAGRNFTDVPELAMPFLPASVDWRQKGIVTPAKDQQSCGSCYSFGTLGVIESAIIQKTGQTLDLSEQQVVDCSFNYAQGMNGGCNGGHEVVVMDFAAARGLVLESNYRYTSGRSQTHYRCQASTGQYAKGLKYRRVAPNDERKLAEAVAAYGPMVISISGENRDFQMFKGGIYDNPRCPKQVDHVVSIVGYGSEGGKDYWIVKNSWGSRWGENGFGKVRRGVNMCGIVSDNSWSIYF